MRFLIFIVMVFMLSACFSNSSIEPPLEVSHKKSEIQFLPKKEHFPPLKEVLTLGLLHEKNDEIAKEREAHFKRKYVTDENDDRNLFEKIVGKATLGFAMGRETKRQYAERQSIEAKEVERYVSQENDERAFIAKSLNKLTLGILEDKETKLEYETRLMKEAVEAQKHDKRGLFLKSIEIVSLGAYTPGKPKPIYAENAVSPHPKLGKLFYGQSTWQDAVNLLGKPFKKVTYASGVKDATFKVNESAYDYVPYLKKPQVNVKLSFNNADILVKK
jgi:hypothetical protein